MKNKFLNSILALFLIFVLAGCPAQVKYVMIAPSDALLLDCGDSVPVDRLVYLQTEKWTDREEILFNKLNEESKVNQKCNLRMKELREWKIKQKQIWESENGPKPNPGIDTR